MSSPALTRSSQPGSLSLDLLKTVVPAGGVIAYIFGLLTTNYYLYRIGESDFGSFHVKFVYTGVYVMVLPVIFWLAFLAFRSTRWHGPWLVGPLVCILGIGLAIYYPVHNNGTSVAAWNGSVYLIGGGLAMAVALLFAVDLLKNHKTRYRMVKWIVIAAAFLIACPNYIQAYADHIYPYSGEQFGGGRGKLVRFWLSKDSLPPAELGLSKAQNDISESVILLFEQDEYFTVCTGMANNTPRVLRIRKSLVNAVQIVPPPQAVKPCWNHTPQEHF